MKGSIIMKLFKKKNNKKVDYSFGCIPSEPDSKDLYWEDTEDYQELKKQEFNSEKVYEDNKKAVKHCVESLTNTSNDIKCVIRNIESIEKKLEWNKICSIEEKVDRIESKLDLIIEKLGDK